MLKIINEIKKEREREGDKLNQEENIYSNTADLTKIKKQQQQEWHA